jgi:hypothetical protein
VSGSREGKVWARFGGLQPAVAGVRPAQPGGQVGKTVEGRSVLGILDLELFDARPATTSPWRPSAKVIGALKGN